MNIGEKTGIGIIRKKENYVEKENYEIKKCKELIRKHSRITSEG